MHAAFVRQRAVATAVATSSLRAAWQRCGGGGCGALTGTNSGGLGTAGRHSQHPRHPPNCGGGACGRARASLGGGGSGGVQLTRNNNNGRRKLVAAASASGDDGAVGGTGGDGGGSEQQWTRSVTSLSVGKTPKAGKQRLDELTIERHPEFSRTVVQSWIAQGKVLVDGQPIVGCLPGMGWEMGNFVCQKHCHRLRRWRLRRRRHTHIYERAQLCNYSSNPNMFLFLQPS